MSFRELTTKASEVYETIVFNNSDDLYNQQAPDPKVTFVLGAVLSAFAVVLWFQRYRKISRAIEKSQWSNNLALRAMISAAIDNDSPLYTIVKIAAQSFVFLGAIQLNYETGFIVMLGFFALESSLDIFRTLLSFFEYKDFDHLVVTSNSMRSQIKKSRTQLFPSSVYEDLSRNQYIVVMVFVTQAILISFVVVDIFNNPLHSCPDGTKGCPVVGTLGSWCFYVLGIFMACVFLLGPKTSYGQSELNPAFWMQLLLFMKVAGCKVSWHDPTFDVTKSRYLTPCDWRIWVRFLMNFLINGLGFHILVHALPIQVAGQNSLTGVVIRAVGMMYLVDLDDTAGYTLTFTNADDEEIKKEGAEAATDQAKGFTDDSNGLPNTLAGEAERIIQEARAKLDALASRTGGNGSVINLSSGIALAAAGGVAGAAAATAAAWQQQQQEDNNNNNNQEEENAPEANENAGAEKNVTGSENA